MKPWCIFVLLAGCTEAEVGTAAEHGRELVSDPSVSGAQLNAFRCTTCHAENATPFLTGAPFWGAVDRKTFWGGEQNDLLTSINLCRFLFMGSTQDWTRDTAEAKAVYAYLSTLRGSSEPAPFTLQREILDLPLGDATRGSIVYDAACRSCHGARSTGQGRLRSSFPVLPDDTIRDHQYLNSRTATRLVFIEKVRHGPFLGYGGIMPPFSKEVLSDADLSALLGFFALSD